MPAMHELNDKRRGKTREMNEVAGRLLAIDHAEFPEGTPLGMLLVGIPSGVAKKILTRAAAENCSAARRDPRAFASSAS
jgi:hypothetical protein